MRGRCGCERNRRIDLLVRDANIADMAATGTATSRSIILRQGRIIASFALAGSVFAGLTLGWVPALAAFDVNAIGASIGGVVGLIANARHLV